MQQRVLASNYLVTLAESAHATLNNSGITDNNTFDVVISLMKKTLHNLEQTRSFTQALTGPLQRGDIETVRQHINNLPLTEVMSLYRTLGKATLKLTGLPEQKKNELCLVLSQHEYA